MNFVQSVASIYVVVLLVFTLGFLINWYRNRAAIAAYKRIGFWAGVIFVIFELLTLALLQSMFLHPETVVTIVIALGWGILRMWGFVNNGIFFSNQLNIRSFPLIAPRLGLSSAPAFPKISEATQDLVSTVAEPLPITPTPMESGTLASEPLGVVTASVAQLEAGPVAPSEPPPTNWPRYWLNIIGVGVGAVIYSAVLFLITRPQPGLVAQSLSLSNESIITPLTLVILLEFAFTEELMFRLGIQNYLGAKLINKRHGYALAVVLTSTLWTMAHVGSLNPDWVKLAQIFPLGLALGWLYRRQGTESTIMAHALFNFVGALVLSPLYLR